MTNVFRYCRLHGGYYGTSCPEYHGSGTLFASCPPRQIAEQYTADPAFKSEVDRALGVFHLPPHKPGVCDGCDAAMAKGQIQDSARKDDPA